MKQKPLVFLKKGEHNKICFFLIQWLIKKFLVECWKKSSTMVILLQLLVQTMFSRQINDLIRKSWNWFTGMRVFHPFFPPFRTTAQFFLPLGVFAYRLVVKILWIIISSRFFILNRKKCSKLPLSHHFFRIFWEFSSVKTAT